MTSPSATIAVQVNGELHQLQPPMTVAGLLAELGIDPRQVAVERNKEIVRKPDYERTSLAEGDALEIVTFVGGG